MEKSNENGSANTGQVCREFLRGECDRGDRCKFTHPDPKDGLDEMKNRVCRDFLRDECTRGDKCIFQHPTGMQGTKRVVKFCHNFQNGKCPRVGCTYLHCTQEEEDYYNETGKLPPGVEDMLKAEQSKKVCKDFLNGKCFRTTCKFLHPETGDHGGRWGDREGGPPRKRPMPHWDDRDAYYPPMRDERERVRSLMHLVNDLEDENMVLRHKLSRIHRQLLDMADDNKVLLDENRRLRALEPESQRAPPRRADPVVDVASLDSYLRDRVPASRGEPSTSRPAARGAGYDSDRPPAYSADHPGYPSNFDY